MTTSDSSVETDVAIVGAGAGGLATAIFTRQTSRQRSVLLIDSARKPGAKILVSGGGRCNVTNVAVTERDFWGGRRSIIREVLRRFPVEDTRVFFERLGVTLHEEVDGKLFPDSNRARDVLAALLGEAERLGVTHEWGRQVQAIDREGNRFVLSTSGANPVVARRVVLATGGQSLPKSGSDGTGYELARRLGHSIVPITPALVPLVLDDREALHARLSGVSHEAELAVWVDGRVSIRLQGPLLWTHFGISGPVVLNASRHWAQARRRTAAVRVTLNFFPGATFEHAEARLLQGSRERPRASISALLSSWLPASVCVQLPHLIGVAADRPAADLSRDQRRHLLHTLVEFDLPVRDSRGYNYAEATAGGVPLPEIDPKTMQSRRCDGLYLVGEILDVDGRIGGFNFQWAWSSAMAAARALAR